MPVNFVMDACAAAKLLFHEVGSQEVRDCLLDGENVIAPDFVLLEIASVAVKKYRRKEVSQSRVTDTLEDAPSLFTQLRPTASLAASAGEIAVTCMISPYDAAYVALAQESGYVLITADRRLSEAVKQLKRPPLVHLIAC
jgi:predicted nucleic acid-binding protein